MKRILTVNSEFKTSYKRELEALLEFSKPKYTESAVFIEFLGWFADSECVYPATEYVPLGDLEENVKANGGTIREAEIKDITIQVLEGLELMHQEKFAYRDLKPKVHSNYLFNSMICLTLTEYTRLPRTTTVVG